MQRAEAQVQEKELPSISKIGKEGVSLMDSVGTTPIYSAASELTGVFSGSP